MRSLCVPLLLAAVPLLAQTHDPFPAKFTPPPCTPANTCQSFDRSVFSAAACHLLPNRPLSGSWLEAHADAVISEYALACRRHATCLATAGNDFPFCDDVAYLELDPVCDRLFPRATNRDDWEQCRSFHDLYLLGVEFHADDLWKSLQPCIRQHDAPHAKPPEVWMTPGHLPAGFTGQVTFFALEPDTHAPLLAQVKLEGQTVLQTGNPATGLATFYPFTYTVHYVRVPNSDGHTDLVPPMVTIKTPAYPLATGGQPWPDVQFRLSADVPKLVLEVTPNVERLHRGANHVTISARDAVTGELVEMRVFVGTEQIGNTNKPLTIELEESGHHPEIWLTSLFNRYSDVVVAKAQ